MIRMSRIARSLALPLALAGSLFACSSSEPEAPPKGDESSAARGLAPVDPDEQKVADRLALIKACNIDMREPQSVEWDTQWNPAVTRDEGEHPSGVRSAHWANEEELAELKESNEAFPLELSCGSDAGSEYTVLVEMVARTSSLTDIPMQAGSYPIVSMSGALKPGEMGVGNLQFNGVRYEARTGNLSISRFDSEGVAGNFVIEGVESGGENRPIRMEVTFDMPCRVEGPQSACKSEAGERG